MDGLPEIRTQPRPAVAMLASAERTSPVAKLVWVLFIGWVGLCVAHHVSLQAENAIQQAALAGNTCVAVISGYVVCRAIEVVTRR